MSNIPTPVMTHSYGLAPDSEAGPRLARALIPMPASFEFSLNMLEVIAAEQIDKIQSVFIDNSAGTQDLTIISEANKISYVVPLGAQAIFPFFIARGNGNVNFARAQVGTIPVYFFNVPMPALVWGGAATDVAAIVAVLNDILTDTNALLAIAELPTLATRSSVAAAAADTLILAANAARKGASVFNDSASATLYLALGTAAATTADYSVKVLPGQFYETLSGFTGQIRGIWSAAVGAAKVTEQT